MSLASIQLPAFLLIFFVSSCVKVPVANDQQVASLVHERINKQVSWHKDELVISSVDYLLKEDLECASAVQIALLHNPRIQASFEELGVAQADLVQAGLFRNPILAGFVRFPITNDSSTNTEISATQSVVEIFLIPLRKKVAEREFEKAQAQVAHKVLGLAFDVEETFYTLQIEQEKLELLQQIVQIQNLSHTIAQRQYQAGNINEPELQSRLQKFLEAQLELSHSQNSIATLRQELTELLGLRLSQRYWRIAKAIPYPVKVELERDMLEKRAFAQRLDLAKARLELKRLFEMGETKKWWTYTDPTVGVSYEKDADGKAGLGPGFSFALPFFDHGQADRARLVACLKQGQHALVVQELEVAKEVRTAFDLLTTNEKQIELLQNELVPLQQKIIVTSQEYYNVMGLGIYQLLQNKEQELRVELQLLTSLQAYWRSKVALERAVGGHI